jgi:hypothetical protein
LRKIDLNLSMGYFLANTNSKLVIKVPAASVNAYKNASCWSEYADRIVAQ